MTATASPRGVAKDSCVVTESGRQGIDAAVAVEPISERQAA